MKLQFKNQKVPNDSSENADIEANPNFILNVAHSKKGKFGAGK
jgi:hypothetical protein